MSASDPQRFVSRFVEAWALPDSGGFAELWLPDGVFVHPSVGKPLPGAAVPGWSERIKASLPDLVFTADEWAARGDLVLLQWTTVASVAGRRLAWSGVDRFRLRGGKIAEEVVYYDTLPMWVALDPSMERPALVDLSGGSGQRPA